VSVFLINVPIELANAIQKFSSENKRIISFCSGAFLLAELGLLDGRKATTHWRYADKFKAKYKHTEYVDDVLYVYDGKIGCSAGSAAAIDLGIAIIKGDYGYKIANTVARRLVMSAHRSGGQSQFVEAPIIEKPNLFSQALDWALKNITTAIDVETFARHANMSRRTFDRKFRSTLNITPNEWISLQRLDVAKQLIETTTYNVDKVAQLSGFENAISMRHHFRKALGISPTQYREQFGHRTGVEKIHGI
ncbi:MAG: helix-turn-helix domain-containing protein, partial [Moraxellaceae bacterium]